MKGLTAAMGQLADHLMQQNHQIQSSLFEQLHAQRPAPGFKAEGTRMPTFSGVPEECGQIHLCRLALHARQECGLHQCANNIRVVAMLASNLRGGFSS
ncbi:hypothetical protein GN244_ATG08557 [Phytophthora infestans]|uniref:Uncharacterized protein n=1 Tax=Phytophthora infestans TaxID=4787 RepID=A0A833T8U1_PHYIN|nr:hypothetical protein GN244_ATG08557 [Phytophthora infestans]